MKTNYVQDKKTKQTAQKKGGGLTQVTSNSETVVVSNGLRANEKPIQTLMLVDHIIMFLLA